MKPGVKRQSPKGDESEGLLWRDIEKNPEEEDRFHAWHGLRNKENNTPIEVRGKGVRTLSEGRNLLTDDRISGQKGARKVS